MKAVLTVALATILLLLALEVGLRLATDAPRGIFLQMVLHEEYLYPLNSEIPRLWGEFPYLIKSNNLGFRGNASIDPVKSSDTLRIAMLGDSITDGFFVDNEDSYPFLLEQLLQRQLKAEVINGAKGGGTVHKQYAIYRKYVKKLDPDIVVVTFVTNDLNEFDNLNRKELLSYSVETEQSSLANWISSYSALGETAVDLYLRARLDGYSSSPPLAPDGT